MKIISRPSNRKQIESSDEICHSRHKKLLKWAAGEWCAVCYTVDTIQAWVLNKFIEFDLLFCCFASKETYKHIC